MTSNQLRLRGSIVLATCLLPLLLPAAARGQVMEELNFDREVKRATDQLAGTRADDVPHQVHYQIKYFDYQSHEKQATYEIFRMPGKARVQITSREFNATRIAVDDGKSSWTKTDKPEPLKIFDFQNVITRPEAQIARLQLERPPLKRTEIEDAPYLCADDGGGTAVCFDPLLHTFTFAQAFDQMVVYDTLLKVGQRYVPGHIQIFQGKKQLLEATGTVSTPESFPADTFAIPKEPGDSDKEAHPVVKQGKLRDDLPGGYGAVQMRVTVDEKGKVRKIDIVDTDSKDLLDSAKHYGKSTEFAPYLVNGQPQPFDTILWYRQYPPPY